MDPKADAIRRKLVAETMRSVEYRQEGGLHKFRLEGKPLHWLYVSEEHLEDNSEEELLSELADRGVTHSMFYSQTSRRMTITSNGLKDEDSPEQS